MKVCYLIPIIALVITGCAVTPTTQIQAFGDSTKAITDKVDSVIDEYNQSALTRSFTDYAATYSGSHANDLTSKLLEDIQQPIDNKAKKGLAIYRANRAIGAYAKSLSALSVAGSRTDIDLASAKLYGSMTAVNTQYKTINENDADLFHAEDFAVATRLITAIGGLIIEEKRNDAIKGIVISADPKIAALCDAINKQLDESGIYDGISTSRQYVLSEEIKNYKTQAQKDTTLEWRRSEIKRLYGLKQGVTNSKLLIKNAQKAIRAIKTSHATLAGELKDNKFNSEAIAQAIGHLKDLENHYDSYETLLLECEKIEKNDKGVLNCADKN